MDESDLFRDDHNNGELAAAQLRNPHAIRARCEQLLDRALEGGSTWLTVDEAALAHLAGQIGNWLEDEPAQPPAPPGSRARLLQGVPHPRRHARHLPSVWRLLEAGGQDRRGQLLARLAPLPPGEQAHALLDLAVVAVLLSLAGPALGPQPGATTLGPWHYTESATGLRLVGQEALAVAVFHGFLAGLFSSRRDRPCQADARGLRALLTDHLAQALQASPAHPFPGLAGRAVALRRLGERLAAQPEVFGEDGRPGALIDLLEIPYGLGLPYTADVTAADLLAQVLLSLSGLGPEGGALGGWALGDCWRHAAVRGPAPSDGWLPLHTGAQRLVLSLLEPFEWAGVQVGGIEALTAPADAWHGQLLLARGVLQWKPAVGLRGPDPGTAWPLAHERVVEWRALTLALLEDLGERVRQRLGLAADQLPMARLDLPGLIQRHAPPPAAQNAQQWSPAAGPVPLQVAGDGPLL